jgi:hypothetical protein
VVSFPQVSPQNLYTPVLSPHARHVSRLSHSSRYDPPNDILWRVQIINLLIM